MQLTINDSPPYERKATMEVRELKEALANFNQTGTLTVAIPSIGQPHELRAVRVVGHLDHPGEVKTDHTVHALDIVVDPWDQPGMKSVGRAMTVADLATMIEPYADPMHVRVAVPITHENISHRMLDISMIGHTTGTGKGSGVQMITENWDNPMQVIKSIVLDEEVA
jgi:hypothetical protein